VVNLLCSTNTGKRPDLPLKKRFVRHARPKNENCCTVGRCLAAGEKTRHSAHRMGSRPEKEFVRGGKTMKTLVKTGVVALLLGASGYAALAGTVSGTIKEPNGAPFRAAFVRVQNLKTKVTMMVLSDNQGRYWTDNLDAGTYAVTPTSVGFKSDPLRRRRTEPHGGGRS
jgi:hypothetical protein